MRSRKTSLGAHSAARSDVAVESARGRARFGLGALLCTGVLALGIGIGSATLPSVQADEATDEAAVVAVVDEDLSVAERVAAEVLPSVGSVYGAYSSGYYSGVVQGSCEVLSADGYILTNYHVIENCTEIQVVLDDTVYMAEVVGSDPTSDVAVLKIDPGETELTPIKIGDSSELKVGQWVMTIGTPYGESGSVAAGIVSGLSRTSSAELEETEAYYVGLIQTDAMINSGSSGGALVNANGEFVGMTTLSGSYSGDWAGMTYAIPSNYCIDIATQIIETGTVQHPQIGVSVTSVMEAYYRGSYSTRNDSSVAGAYVAAVVAGSGADEAGVQVGDVITEVDGTTISSSDDLIIAVRSHAIGDTVTLTIERDNQTLELDVVLGSDADTANATYVETEEPETTEEEDETPSLGRGGSRSGSSDSDDDYGFGSGFGFGSDFGNDYGFGSDYGFGRGNYSSIGGEIEGTQV